MAKITLKNISSATVVIGTSDGTMRSRSLAPNRVITLTPTEYEDLMYELQSPDVANDTVRFRKTAASSDSRPSESGRKASQKRSVPAYMY